MGGAGVTSAQSAPKSARPTKNLPYGTHSHPQEEVASREPKIYKIIIVSVKDGIRSRKLPAMVLLNTANYVSVKVVLLSQTHKTCLMNFLRLT